MPLSQLSQLKLSVNLCLVFTQLTELPECAGYRQFVRDLNPCVREKLLMCGGAVFDSNVRDLDGSFVEDRLHTLVLPFSIRTWAYEVLKVLNMFYLQ